MIHLELPKTTIVNRFIPKNNFDEYSNTSQKKKFTDNIDKITWLNKLSKETINLNGNEIKEIQIFEVKLKVKENILSLLNIIDKAIPYHIIFICSYESEYYISTSKKHNHINNESNAVLDWTFSTLWHTNAENKFKINLKESIDFVYTDLCSQISGYHSKNINDIIDIDKTTSKLKRQIEDLELKIKREKQFNLKVEMNSELKVLKLKLESISNTLK